MKQLAKELDRIFKDPELRNYMYKGMVASVWEVAVGKQINSIAQIQYFNNGTLFVKVQSATWRNELSMMRHTIRDKINAALELHVVKNIVFR